MRLGIIGNGAISQYVRHKAVEDGHSVQALLLRPESLQRHCGDVPGNISCVSNVADLPEEINHMIDCAGHTALRSHGPMILRKGIDLTTVSLGALADATLLAELNHSAIEGNSKLHLSSGAIGALDCLRAARVGGLQEVKYVGRKPPLGWIGSPAETQLDLENLTDRAEVHFTGSARNAALDYPKNANVAAAVALAGIGFDKTQVVLIADPGVTENIHEIQASGRFGSFSFEIRGRSLPDNPRSSALAAMSVIATLEQISQRVGF